MYGIAKYLKHPDTVPMFHLSPHGRDEGDRDVEGAELHSSTTAERASVSAYQCGGAAEAIAVRNGCSERDPADIFINNFPLFLEELQRWQSRALAN